MINLTAASSPAPKRPFRTYALNGKKQSVSTKESSDAAPYFLENLTLATSLLAVSTRWSFILSPICTNSVSF